MLTHSHLGERKPLKGFFDTRKSEAEIAHNVELRGRLYVVTHTPVPKQQGISISWLPNENYGYWQLEEEGSLRYDVLGLALADFAKFAGAMSVYSSVMRDTTNIRSCEISASELAGELATVMIVVPDIKSEPSTHSRHTDSGRIG